MMQCTTKTALSPQNYLHYFNNCCHLLENSCYNACGTQKNKNILLTLDTPSWRSHVITVCLPIHLSLASNQPTCFSITIMLDYFSLTKGGSFCESFLIISDWPILERVSEDSMAPQELESKLPIKLDQDKGDWIAKRCAIHVRRRRLGFTRCRISHGKSPI